jgi:lysyl-tRNA synthetase class 2
MLEWYRVDMDEHALMNEVAELIQQVLGDRAPIVEKISYRDAFLKHIGIDPHRADVPALRECAHRLGFETPRDMPNDRPEPWRDLLLTHAIEPHLGRGTMTFLYDYPASQAALARVRPGDPPLAERFELYMEGSEIANGFHELANVDEQRRRFEGDLMQRRLLGLAEVPWDRHFLEALTSGLPDCSGVALGFDRLVMIAAAASSITDVLSFPLERT